MKTATTLKWHRDGQTVCPKCSSTNVVAIEYAYPSPERYDGISEYKCVNCGYRQGRWTGKELKMGYIEPQLGHGGEPVPILEE